LGSLFRSLHADHVGNKPAARRRPLLDRVLTRVLRSSVSGAVDGVMLLLTLHGRRSGEQITLPVQRAVGRNAPWIYVGRAETNTWWRNLAEEAPVQVRLRGRTVQASVART
jgi:F420H(2)-dependent quinone reductase